MLFHFFVLILDVVDHPLSLCNTTEILLDISGGILGILDVIFGLYILSSW